MKEPTGDMVSSVGSSMRELTIQSRLGIGGDINLVIAPNEIMNLIMIRICLL